MSISLSHSIESSWPRLCRGAEDCLQTMHLKPSDEIAVRNCIYRYSTPSSFCEFLNWLVFRVTNAFNAIQGKMTEWQIAKNLVHDHVVETAIRREIISRNPQNELERVIKNHVIESSGFISEKFLDLCLYVQDQRSPSSDGVRQKLQEMDLIHFMENQVRSSVNRVRSRAASN